MEIIILSFILALGIYWFIVGKHVPSIMVFVFFLTDGLQIIPENFSSVKFFDFALLYVIVICIYLGIKVKGAFALSDPLSKILLLLFIYLLLEFIFTVVTERETLAFAFKVFRQYLFFGLYFVIRSIKPKAISKIVKSLFVLTTATLVVYLAQLVFKQQILTGAVTDLEVSITDTASRYRNIPYFFYFFLFYVFFDPSLKKLRIPAILFYLIGLVAPLNRGPIIAFVVVLTLFLFVQGKVGSLFKYALLAIAIGAVSWPILSRRFNKENANGDIQNSLQLRSYKNFAANGGGNFEFRILLLKERVNYIFDHPEYILTGIGMRHEDSPNTQSQYNFYLGATKKDLSGRTVKQQIDTTDLVWASMLLRFGFLGILLYLIVFFHFLKVFYKHKDVLIATIGFLLTSMYLLNSFATDILIRPTTFFLLFLAYSYILKPKTKDILFNGLKPIR